MHRNRALLVAGAAVLLLVIVAAAVLLARRGGGEDELGGVPPGSTGPAGLPAWIELHFTTPQPKGAPSPSGTSGRLDEQLVAALDGTRVSVDMAIYDLELESVADALIRAKGRGVRVRMVTDTDNVKLAQVKRVRDAGIPVVEDNRGPIMHHKFVVLDGEAVWTGSWNFTPNDTFRYNNNAALLRSRALAENYAAEFDKMFTSHAFGPTKPKAVPHPRVEIGGAVVETIFESEGDAPTRIVERIKGAQRSIDFLAYTFTDDAIGDALVERARVGVAVRGVIETLQSDRKESELGRLRGAGLDAAQPAGMPLPACAAGPGVLTDGNPYLMHHKVIVIDGQTAIFGSFNFTQNAAKDNDENLLIVDEPAVARAFLEEFCRVYDVAAEKAAKK